MALPPPGKLVSVNVDSTPSHTSAATKAATGEACTVATSLATFWHPNASVTVTANRCVPTVVNEMGAVVGPEVVDPSGSTHVVGRSLSGQFFGRHHQVVTTL